MLPEVKLTISQNDKVLHTIVRDMKAENTIRSLEEFQVEANAVLTKMIQERGDTAGGDFNMDEDDETDDDDSASLSSSAEQNGHSKCKKKKCV